MIEMVNIELDAHERDVVFLCIKKYCETHLKSEITIRGRNVQDYLKLMKDNKLYVSADDAYAINRCLMLETTDPRNLDFYNYAHSIYSKIAREFDKGNIDYFKYIEKYQAE